MVPAVVLWELAAGMELPRGTDVCPERQKSSVQHWIALINPLSSFMSWAVIISALTTETPTLSRFIDIYLYKYSLYD